MAPRLGSSLQVSYFHHLNKHRVLLGTELVVPFSPMLGAPTTTFGFQYNFRASKLHGQVNALIATHFSIASYIPNR